MVARCAAASLCTGRRRLRRGISHPPDQYAERRNLVCVVTPARRSADHPAPTSACASLSIPTPATRSTRLGRSTGRTLPGALPDRGLVAANYDNDNPGPVRPASLPQNGRETVLEKAGWRTSPVKRGSPPILPIRAIGIEGVDFIIERALASSPETPLVIAWAHPPTSLGVSQGAAHRRAVVVFWHFRTRGPAVLDKTPRSFQEIQRVKKVREKCLC